jgi:hypothetical protein
VPPARPTLLPGRRRCLFTFRYGDPMQSRVLVCVGAWATGALLWGAAALTELGSVTAGSSDPSSRAVMMTDVPPWVSAAKPMGLAVMGFAIVGALVFRAKRR